MPWITVAPIIVQFLYFSKNFPKKTTAQKRKFGKFGHPDHRDFFTYISMLLFVCYVVMKNDKINFPVIKYLVLYIEKY
jgi:hypothetical protein